MADKVQNVRTNVYINNKDAGKNLRTLQKESRKLRNEIAGLTPGTKQYIAATKRMREVSGTIRNINKEIRGMNNAWRQAKQVFVGAVGAFGFTELIRGFGNVLTGVKNTRKEFEVYEAVLTNALGSQREANKQLAMMERLASETPFSIKELTDSYVKLVNRGFKPTSAEIIKLGDLTSSLGKSYDQLVEAMLDAQTGEFERLKEFGIKARKEGEQVRFTFKGLETQVEFTEDAIKNYIMSLGDLAEIKGSMASIAATTTGAESNLADVYDSLANTIGKRLNPAYGNFLRSLSKSLGLLQRWVGLRPSDEMEKSRVALLGMKVQLMDTNLATEKRVTIINELKKQYPGYLSDLDAEKTTNQELLPLLDEINMHLIKRIALQKAQEDLNQKQEDYAYHVGRQAQNMVELAELTGKVADAENIMLTENVDLLTQAEILWEKLNRPMMGDAGKIGRLIYNEIKPTKKVIDAYNDSVDRALANVSKINAQVDQMLGIDKLDATIANEEAEEKARLDRMGRQAEREVQEIAKLEKFKFDEKMIIVRDFISREAGMISGWQAENYQKLSETDSDLVDAKIEGLQRLANATGAFVERNSELFKAMFVADKATGIAQLIIELQKQIAFITTKYAALPGGLALAAGEIAAAKIRTGIGVATIAAQSAGQLQSFAEGGYTGFGFGMPDQSGFRVAGITHEGEYTIPKWMMQDSQVANVVGALENIRTSNSQSKQVIERQSITNTTVLNQDDVVALLSQLVSLAQQPNIALVPDKTIRDIKERMHRDSIIQQNSKLN